MDYDFSGLCADQLVFYTETMNKVQRELAKHL